MISNLRVIEMLLVFINQLKFNMALYFVTALPFCIDVTCSGHMLNTSVINLIHAANFALHFLEAADLYIAKLCTP